MSLFSNVQPSQQVRFWDTPVFKNSLIGLVTLIALAAITIGAISYSGAGLNQIGNSAALGIMIGGGAVLATTVLYLYFREREEVLVYEDAEMFKNQLNNGEFFVYRNRDVDRKMLMVNNKKADIEVMELGYFNLDMLKDYKQVSLEELQKRSNLK